MKNLILISISFILAGQISAQRGFYIKPLIDKKGYLKKDPVKLTILSAGNQPFDLTGTSFYGLTDFGCEMGLLIGYNFKKITIETGLATDGTNCMLKFKYSEYTKSDTSYRTSWWNNGEGVALTKVPVRLYYNLLKKDSLRKDKRNFTMEGSFFAGIDIVFKPVGTPDKPMIVDEIDFLAANGKTISVTESLYATREHWDFLRTLGFSLKFYKRERNLFNLSVYGSWGHLNLSEIRFDLKNTDGTHYIHSEYAKADGIYIGISKELSFRNARNDFNRKFR
jgi:hypothetical protein